MKGGGTCGARLTADMHTKQIFHEVGCSDPCSHMASFWIVRGLLASGMRSTARGMVLNLLWCVRQWGFMPNGARCYYLNRR